MDTLFIEIPKEELHSNKNGIVGVCYRPPHVCNRKFTEELYLIHPKPLTELVTGLFLRN